MRVSEDSTESGGFARVGYRGLSVVSGVLTLLTFASERVLYETAGRSLGDVPAYVMGGVLLLVAAGAFHASVSGRGVDTALLLSGGPIGGLAVYLLGYHLVSAPSTDSPTWLIFLAFSGGVLALGVGAYLCGRVVDAAVRA